MHFPDIEVDTFVAMPNHIHGVIVIARPTPRATRAHLFQLIAQNGVLVLENADGHDHFAGHARPRPTLF